MCGRVCGTDQRRAQAGNSECQFTGTFKDGSDGTRTRDLRRDRPAVVETELVPLPPLARGGGRMRGRGIASGAHLDRTREVQGNLQSPKDGGERKTVV